MDSDLAWVNGKSWCYADAFKRSIISGAIYYLEPITVVLSYYKYVIQTAIGTAMQNEHF